MGREAHVDGCSFAGSFKFWLASTRSHLSLLATGHGGRGAGKWCLPPCRLCAAIAGHRSKKNGSCVFNSYVCWLSRSRIYAAVISRSGFMVDCESCLCCGNRIGAYCVAVFVFLSCPCCPFLGVASISTGKSSAPYQDPAYNNCWPYLVVFDVEFEHGWAGKIFGSGAGGRV